MVALPFGASPFCLRSEEHVSKAWVHADPAILQRNLENGISQIKGFAYGASSTTGTQPTAPDRLPARFSSWVEKFTGGCASLKVIFNSFLGFSYSYPTSLLALLMKVFDLGVDGPALWRRLASHTAAI